MECDEKNGIVFAEDVNFNSRTHVECDAVLAHHPRQHEISTHALTWSATLPGGVGGFPPTISTHALTWSATSDKHRTRQAVWISTHALTWSATNGFCNCDIAFGISTHALTWSATVATSRKVPDFEISTHALTWSATSRKRKGVCRCNEFQLTHSRGVRPGAAVKITAVIKNFNSRTHVECDI